ncbi:MAG: glycosyltransferase family 2 protein [Devosia sp.]|nr:glycosyltransferase family 2 protein [Devosia sp.]
MTEIISVIMPAYKAGAWIEGAVRSLLAQRFAGWRLLVVADDGTDYEAMLARQGLRDSRLRFLSSGGVATGAANTRNAGFEAIDTPYAALLDADDRFTPQKLERVVAALETHAIVSTAIDVLDSEDRHLRYVGDGPDRPLAAGEHKWVNLSMDTMIAWDRRKTDARFDPALPNMADLDFLMRLYARSPGSFHLGEPLHLYVKQPNSLSNTPGVAQRMIAAKTLIRERLAAGYYRFADPRAAEGIDRFLEISTEAERRYPGALAARPGLLFEDHLEPMLRAASTSAA